MVKFGKERFDKNYQGAVGMKAMDMLHKNSVELVEILAKHNLINSTINVFELGAGPARNLYYIYKTLLENDQDISKVKFAANDLWKEESLAAMDPEIKEIINFIEGDSEDVINNNIIPDLDIFLVSDHFMHLQYEKADYIIKKILSDWKPKYIMLREIKKEFETPDHPRLYHNYDQFLTDYEIVEDKTSVQTDRYFIWLLKKK
jgi:hypothetical protein